MAPPKKPKPKTYDWILKASGRIECFESPAKKQSIVSFWPPTEFTAFHTEELSRATKAIQGILNDVEKAGRRRDQRLSFIVFDGRLLLVWAHDTKRPSKRGLGSDAEYSRIVKALQLRAPARQSAKTRSWIMTSDGHVRCFKSNDADCIVIKLWETLAPTEFRPRELMEATKTVQAILNEIERSNAEPERHLSIILYDYRPLLAWTLHGNIGPDDDIRDVRKALKLPKR